VSRSEEEVGGARACGVVVCCGSEAWMSLSA